MTVRNATLRFLSRQLKREGLLTPLACRNCYSPDFKRLRVCGTCQQEWCDQCFHTNEQCAEQCRINEQRERERKHQLALDMKESREDSDGY